MPVFTWHSPCVSESKFPLSINYIGLGAHPTPLWSHFNQVHLLYFYIRSLPEVVGLDSPYEFGEGHSPTHNIHTVCIELVRGLNMEMRRNTSFKWTERAAEWAAASEKWLEKYMKGWRTNREEKCLRKGWWIFKMLKKASKIKLEIAHCLWQGDSPWTKWSD